ncbi:hypothetical protein EXIGLDRAFT_761320 [Exidia glandulosa HHB12029]|uniref:Uncharacterized protein n=1 Tax=Exidia glandulosa HHB12029 TaxID=1314781 RepID=A0A165NHN9_EXIGL|nr:hypothetical protein EXIGLDRAFT_761320 [Exidia glandulosa HHB12029]
MSTLEEVPTQLDHLFILLGNLPKTIPEGEQYYSKSRFEPAAAHHQRSDGTYINALHIRLEIVFGELDGDEPIRFLERGDGLLDLVNILRDAFESKTGDKHTIRRWVERLTLYAKKIPSARRKSVKTKKAQGEDGLGEDDPPPSAAPGASKRKASVTEKPEAAKKKKTDIRAFMATPTATAAGASTLSASGKGGNTSKKKVSEPTSNTAPPPPSAPTAAVTHDVMVVDSDEDKDYHPPKNSKKATVTEISSDDDSAIDEPTSDGESALRKVEADEEAERNKGTRRGPKNAALQYWRKPHQISKAGKPL